jgi:hypothetical protein
MKLNTITTLFVGLLLLGFPLSSQAGPAPDADGDGIPDVVDNCTLVAQGSAGVCSSTTCPGTCDNDQDGYGNACDTDLDNDFFTLGATDYDLIFFPEIQNFTPNGLGDHNCDGFTLTDDYDNVFFPAIQVFAQPGPSGLSCAGTTPCP